MNEQINTNEESTNDSFSQIDHRNETMPKTTTTTTTKVTKKRSKDPHAPKRFRTAYLLFSNEKREEVKVKMTKFIRLHLSLSFHSERKSEFIGQRSYG